MAEGKTTISVIKADIGSIGGHIKPSQRLLDRVTEFVEQEGRDLITDSFISHTGDDIAILMAHT
ncbi:MAG: fructose 1,6-bisphosphatase, partial [Nitrospinae bacterium]|nr:fructose 1,6-bisphosphatase [Nitrospinota bacterium]